MRKIISYLFLTVLLFYGETNATTLNVAQMASISPVIVTNAGLIDEIMINGRRFDSLNKRTIEFYKDDLKDGKVLITGLLEREDGGALDDLQVEITTDGGTTWSRAAGHANWEWFFQPQTGKTYEFSIRVVQAIPASDLIIPVPSTLSIAGFSFTPDSSATLVGGLLSGTGKITIPYFEQFSLPQDVAVAFDDLNIANGVVISGKVTSQTPFTLSTDAVDISVSKLVISATPDHSTLEGSAKLKGFLGALPVLPLENGSKLLVSSFQASVAVNSQSFVIWQEKGVKLTLGDGSVRVNYNLGDSKTTLDLSGLTTSVKFGTLLTDAANTSDSITASLLSAVGTVYSLRTVGQAYLLNSAITLNNAAMSIDIADINAPKITLNSSIDFSGYNHAIIKKLTGGTITADISKTGFSAAISFANALAPATLLNRGGLDKNVRMEFTAPPEFSISIAKNGDLPTFNLNGLSAKLNFGDLLTNAKAQGAETATSVVANIAFAADSASNVILSFPETAVAYLPGGKFGLAGINASLNPGDLSVSINASANLDAYADPVFNAFSGTAVRVAVASTGVTASLTADSGIDPIVLMNRGGAGKDVLLTVNGTPSATLTIGGNTVDLSFGALNASVKFGDILQSAKGSFAPVVASLQSAADNARQYTLSFPNGPLYLLGSSFGLEGVSAGFNLGDKTISLTGSANLQDYSAPLLKAMSGSTLSATIAPAGFSATLTPVGQLAPFTVLDRGGSGKDVQVAFTTPPTVRLTLRGGDIDFGLDGGSAEIRFGDLLEQAVATLTAQQNEARQTISGMYNWSLEGRRKLIDESKMFLSSLKGSLDLKTITTPKISFNAQADLHEYGGLFSTVTNAQLSNALISGAGVSGTLAVNIGSIDIWQEKGVKVVFTENPSLRFALGGSGFSLGFASIAGNLNFGALLENAVAEIRRATPDTSELEVDAKNATTTATAEMLWNINGAKKLAGSTVSLQNLAGTLNIADISAPSISLNATADLSQYGGILSSVSSAALEGVTISKTGLKGTLSTSLREIDIWKDKNVKLSLTTPAKFKLDVTSSGVSVGIGELNGSVDFGDLLNNATAQLNTVSNGVHGWALNEVHALDSGSIKLQNLAGQVDLTDLSKPRIGMNGQIDLKGYGGIFSQLEPVAVENATITLDGFKADVSVPLVAVDIWETKKVKVNFTGATPPLLNMAVTRDGLKAGLSNLSAKLQFGDLLGGIEAELTQAVGLPTQPSLYKWSVPDVPNPRTLLTDNLGSVTVSGINGTFNLSDLSNPAIVFDAAADFSSYSLPGFTLSTVALDDARISRSGIEWNMRVQGETTITVLDLGEESQDVRLVLAGSTTAGTNGVGADGSAKLYFGALFDSVEPVVLVKDGNNFTFPAINKTFTYIKAGQSISFSDLYGTVTKVGDAYKISLGGTAELQSTLLSKIGTQSINFSDLEISSAGFKGSINATWINQTFDILGGKAKIVLRSATVAIDSSATLPIKLTALDGSLDLTPLFAAGQSALGALSMNGAQLGWTLPNASFTYKDNFIFKNLSGTLDLDNLTTPSIGLSGNFSYKGITGLDLALNNFSVTAAGLSGTVALANGAIAVGTLSGLKLTSLSATFGGTDTISGSVALTYSNNSFLGSGKAVNLAFGANISENGIGDLTLSGTAPNVEIANFAKLIFTNVAATPAWENFSITLDGTVKPDNPLFKAASSLELKGLKISSSGISVEGAGMEFDVSGANALLGGFPLSISKLGIGFDDSTFYLSAKGELSLDIAKAGAGVKLKSNGGLSVDNISIAVTQPAVSFGGEVAWYSSDPTFGNGFGASGLSLKIAEMFSVTGTFKTGTSTGGRYWMAKAQGGLGGGIPMTPLPLSIYEAGGGAAYNMTYREAEKDFVPGNAKNVVIILSSLIGTNDVGYTWHGQFEIALDSAKQITATGDSYLLSEKDKKPGDRKISAIATLTSDSFQINGDANITYEIFNFNGNLDILMSSSAQHVYVGTNRDMVSISLVPLGLSARGYFMIDNRQLAFGALYELKKRLSLDWWGPNPWVAIDAEAGAEGRIYYNPFFMDLGAHAAVTLSAGYGSVFSGSLGMGMDLRFRAPDPTYAKVKLKFYLPVYDGWVSFTTYFPSKPASVSSDSYPPLINEIEPGQDSDVSLFPALTVSTTLASDGTLFAKDDSIEEKDKIYHSEVVGLKLTDTQTNQNIPLATKLAAGNEHEFIPRQLLAPGHSYTFSGKVNLLKNNKVVKTDSINKTFATTTADELKFDEIIELVTPLPLAVNVMNEVQIVMKYKDIINYLPRREQDPHVQYRLKVTNQKDEVITGTTSYHEATRSVIFQPGKDLVRAVYYCRYEATGEVRNTVKNDRGEYLNPFKNFQVDSVQNASSGNSSALSLAGSATAHTAHLDRYTYYTHDRYKITITDPVEKVVYFSTFTAKHSLTATESLQRFDGMNERLDPSLSIMTDTGDAKRVYLKVNSALGAIGIEEGIGLGYRLTTTWQVEGGADVIITDNHEAYWPDKYMLDLGVRKNFTLPVSALKSAVIEYYNTTTNAALLTQVVRIVNGGTTNQSQHEADMQGVADRVKGTSGRGQLTGSVAGAGGFTGVGGMAGSGGFAGSGGGGLAGGGLQGVEGIGGDIGAQLDFQGGGL
ncbi:MAG: hypothetical protein PHN84_10560 [Desulfuromonadaceae bacterium]|nr:hypothetical protein [Desulfuromonadaceae bacterium]MDD2853995.1 hypothetical protein [Desulfuromonadaceae bacterium]